MDSFNVAVMNDSTDNTMALMSSMPTTRLSPEEATRMLVEALATFHRDPTAEMDCHLFSVSSETFQCIRQTLEAIFNEDSDGERFFRQYIQCLQEAIKEQQEIFSKAQQFTSDYMDCLKYVGGFHFSCNLKLGAGAELIPLSEINEHHAFLSSVCLRRVFFKFSVGFQHPLGTLFLIILRTVVTPN